MAKPEVATDGKSLVELWKEHQEKRARLINKGMSVDAVEKEGYKNYTYDEFKKAYMSKHPRTEEETLKEKENKERRLAGLRLAKNIEAYHNQGKEANEDGFNLSVTPSIIKIDTDGLS